jgi:Cu2+-containing amine oxidase
MARKESLILTFEPKEAKEKKMPRTKITLAEAKKGLAVVRKEMASAKKAVTATQKEFTASPDKETAKEYRGAVSTHIAVTTRYEKAAAKVAELQDAD